MDNTNAFVDQVYLELVGLYGKDKNIKKQLLGREPIKKIFDIYSDWLAQNLALNPKVAANAIYKDVIRVGYLDFANRGLKRGVQLKGQSGFNLIYGTQKEIDAAAQTMNTLKAQNPVKYSLMITALQKIKELSDRAKPAKNIFGKTTNVAKQAVAPLKMPTYGTFNLLMKMNEKQLQAYIAKFGKALPKPAPQQP